MRRFLNFNLHFNFYLLLSFFLLTSFYHKFYVSISEVNHNTETAALEISMKIFTDDLEAALEVDTSEKLWIGDPEREAAATDSLLAVYFDKKLTLNINGEEKEAIFIGKELEADVTWCYLEIQDLSAVKSVSIDNRILMELFDDQKNLVHIYANGKEKSLFLRRGKTVGEVVY